MQILSHHDITEILLKVALNTITPNLMQVNQEVHDRVQVIMHFQDHTVTSSNHSSFKISYIIIVLF